MWRKQRNESAQPTNLYSPYTTGNYPYVWHYGLYSVISSAKPLTTSSPLTYDFSGLTVTALINTSPHTVLKQAAVIACLCCTYRHTTILQYHNTTKHYICFLSTFRKSLKPPN